MGLLIFLRRNNAHPSVTLVQLEKVTEKVTDRCNREG